MSDIAFRPAREDDKPSLLALEQALIKAERPFNALLKDVGAHYYDVDFLIQDDNTRLLVGEIEGQIVATGYVQIRTSKASLVHEAHGYLGFMFVADAYRGRGLNKLVMQQLIDWGKSQGARYFYLDVYSQNDSAIRAYEKLGFQRSLMEMVLDTSN